MALCRPGLFQTRAERAKRLRGAVSRGGRRCPRDADGLLFLPWLNGSGPPAANGDVRGGFFNQTLRTSRAQAMRAVMEGVAFNLRWLLPHVERFVGKRFDVIRVWWEGRPRPICGARFVPISSNRPIHRMEQPRMATVRGAAPACLPVVWAFADADEISGPGPRFGRVSADPSEPPDVRRAFLGVRGVLQANTGTFHAIEPTTQRRTGEPPWPRQLNHLPTVWPT